jgi:hypothetical protein
LDRRFQTLQRTAARGKTWLDGTLDIKRGCGVRNWREETHRVSLSAGTPPAPKHFGLLLWEITKLIEAFVTLGLKTIWSIIFSSATPPRSRIPFLSFKGCYYILDKISWKQLTVYSSWQSF